MGCKLPNCAINSEDDILAEVPNEDSTKRLEAHLTTYLDPIEEKQRVEEYIKLLKQEVEQLPPSLSNLNFSHLNENKVGVSPKP